MFYLNLMSLAKLVYHSFSTKVLNVQLDFVLCLKLVKQSLGNVNLNLLYSITGTQRYIRIFLSFDCPMIKTMLTGYLIKSIKSVVP